MKSDETSSRFIEEAVVCEQPKMDLGVCHKGSTTDVAVTFQAVRSGVHEVVVSTNLSLSPQTDIPYATIANSLTPRTLD